MSAPSDRPNGTSSGDSSKHHVEKELMGPLLRRKKVVSMPLGAGGEFFVTDDIGGPHRQLVRTKQKSEGHRLKKVPEDEEAEASVPVSPARKQKQDSWMGGIVRRKQVSLDLLGPNDFFETPTAEEPELAALREEEEERQGLVAPKKLFLPLRFAPRTIPKHGISARKTAAEATGTAEVDEETLELFKRYSSNNEELRLSLASLQYKAQQQPAQELAEQVMKDSERLQKTQDEIREDEKLLKSKFGQAAAAIEEEEDFALAEDIEIIRAQKPDKIKAALCAVIMLALTILVSTWHTHLNDDSFIYGPVGLACTTECLGNLTTRDFFHGGKHSFEKGDVIEMVMHIDHHGHAEDKDVNLIAEIVGAESGQVKAIQEFGPVGHNERETERHKVVVDFENPEEAHVINVNSTHPDITVSFTLDAILEAGLSEHSVAIAAVIMVVVYLFILLEVIHRMLVAIFGSMVALMFLFVMTDGETESIKQIMLHLEWSTLGLLFGMMVIVGELSHTGIFEWCAVRVLVASKGSFNRLICLLCILTAVASAFLDNVTTMLLVAPVTIDMCNILDIDPRPYLIGEVLLSNVGGTATLIGDPPNIIIGSSYEEIGFVDFIINVLPAIFAFCVPASILAVIWIYRYYFTSQKMKVLDADKLKEAYPIYDEPRLMIAGTVTLFVVFMFFLHPVHHKDTAWVALLGAFVTISFTNPHDVQDALRNHVEWDVLLFFAGLFILVEVCAAMGLLDAIGDMLSDYIQDQPEDKQLSVAITLILWVSAFVSAFLDNIPYTTTMVPVIQIIHEALPDSLPLETLAWALSFGACLGGNGTLLGASANIVTAGISTNKGYSISFLNFLYPGMIVMVITVAISNLYMLIRYDWAA